MSSYSFLRYIMDKPSLSEGYVYILNCTNATSGDAISDMVDGASEISYAAFVKVVGIEELSATFPDYNWTRNPRAGLRLNKDRYVRYYKSKFRGVPCVYVDHSAIEYVFVPSEYVEQATETDN